MVDLYGKAHSRLMLERRTGDLGQFAGITAYTLNNGPSEGIRCLEFRTGTGLRFVVMIDRALDIGVAEHRGAAIGWQSPTGFRHPGLHEHADEHGLSWLRSLSGLVQTCGLDHTLFMDADPAEHYHYVHRKTVDSSLHGRIANLPGVLLGYGEHWDGDECTLWCEGRVVQATVFGEDLHLLRRIEAGVGTNTFTIRDTVVNHGFYRTPHMYLYHINIGYPLLDEGTRFLAPIRHVRWASHADALEAQGVGYRTQPGPRTGFHEQVYEHAVESDPGGRVPVLIENRAFDGGRGLGLVVEFDRREFPCLFEWQNLQEGLYALALEPSTNHVFGKPFARERGELRWLEHGQEATYTTRFEVLDDVAGLDGARSRILDICPPPDDEYPPISNDFGD